MKPTFALASCLSLALLSRSASATPQVPVKTSPAAAYGNLPLLFEPNQGQAEPTVQFVSHGEGYALELRGNQAIFSLRNRVDTVHADSLHNPKSSTDQNPTSLTGQAKSTLVHMNLIGSRANPSVAKEDAQPTRTSYFLGNNPALWKSGIPNYGRIRYRSIYNGIDLVYYGNQRRLEHDFIVAPHADPSQITLSFGATTNPTEDRAADISIDPATGDLLLSTKPGELRLLKPVTYQQINGRRIEIPTTYQLLPHHRVRFSVAGYDHSNNLIIDPVLAYSTYLGGSGSTAGGDQANGIAVDSEGSAYIIGTTDSSNFPTTPGAFQTQNNAIGSTHPSTVFVSKLNAAGTGLVYSTYLGGSSGEAGYAIALDSSNDAYITGATWSTDFPITCGAVEVTNQTKTPNAPTGFVAKLTPSGDHLAYSTYLGGQGSLGVTGGPDPGGGDVAQAIAVTESGNAVVAGYTASINFPVTSGVFQHSFRGVSLSDGQTYTFNAFVTEFNPLGTGLIYSTYLGGSGYPTGDHANSVAVDHAGDVFVTGTTDSPDFPTTPGTLQPTAKSSATTNAFVTELNPLGEKEIYSTFLGGTGTTSAMAVALDSSGLAYVAGMTNASDYPLTADVVEGSSLGYLANLTAYGPVGFLTKLSSNASQALYSTLVEGHDTSITALAIDASDNAYLSGTSTTVGAGGFAAFQSTPGALSLPASTGTSAFVAKLNASASKFNYASLLGGSANDSATALAVDSAGNTYIAGAALSTNFPVSNGAYQSTNHAAANQASNAFVSKFELGTETNQTGYNVGIPAKGIPTTITLNSAEWIAGDDWALLAYATLNSGGPGPPPTGQIVLNVTGTGNCCQTTSPMLPTTSWSGATPSIQLWNYPQGEAGPGSGFEVDYSGDAIYQPSTVTGTACIAGETCSDAVPIASPGAQHMHPIAKATLHVADSTQTFSPAGIRSAKFTLPQLVRPNSLNARPDLLDNPASAASTPCTAGFNLRITPKNASKVYGQPNPALLYTVSGLHSGDTVTVTPSTTATQDSPVGVYPLTASVSGADAANYAITIDPATLTVRQASLYIQAQNVHLIYGQTPPNPLPYNLIGFLDGDTAADVSGAPALSTTASAASPVGIYPITIHTGTLAAQNYSFLDFYSGEGAVQIFKAPLLIHTASFTIHAGDSLPAFTYTLSGFVNGDTQATATTGAASITTTAPRPTKAGRYYIIGSTGTLQSPNYTFNEYVSDYGILTVLP